MTVVTTSVHLITLSAKDGDLLILKYLGKAPITEKFVNWVFR